MPRLTRITLTALMALSLAPRAHAQHTLYPDIPYAHIKGVDPNLLSLDVYVPDDADGTNPVMIMYHGGSFISGDKAIAGVVHPKMDYYTGLGWVFVSVNYRLTNVNLPIDHPDQVTHPDHVIDAAASIAWIRENIATYGADPDKLVLMGFSAGSQLVALVATDDSRLAAEGHSITDIHGVICLDGLYDIPLRYKQPPPLPPPHMNLVWGFDLPSQQDMSPRLHVESNKCIAPMLVVHQNLPNQTEQSELFVQTLAAAGYDASVYNAVGKSHSEIGANVGIPDDPLTIRVDEFLATIDFDNRACCRTDYDNNGVVNAADVGAFLSQYFVNLDNGGLEADFDGNGVVNAADVGAFLSAYFQELANPECAP